MTNDAPLQNIGSIGPQATIQGGARLLTPEVLKFMPEHIQKTVKEMEEAATKDPMVVMTGAFGDTTDCDAVVKFPVLTPAEGGVFTQLFGTPFLFKGHPTAAIVDMVGLPKSMLSLIPRETIGRSLYLKVVLFGLFIFSRKQFWHLLRTIFGRIHDLSLLRVRYPREEMFCKVVRHLRYTFNEVMRKKKELDVNSNKVLLEQTDYIGPREKWIFLAFLMELIYHLLEFDNAYRFRFQDIVVLINKENMKRDPKNELQRLIGIAMEREQSNGMRNKWQFMKLLITWACLFREWRDFLRDYFLELEVNELRMDEHDFYFSRRRKTYNFEGKSFEERIKEKEKIDEEKGFVSLQAIKLRGPDGVEKVAVKLSDIYLKYVPGGTAVASN